MESKDYPIHTRLDYFFLILRTKISFRLGEKVTVTDSAEIFNIFELEKAFSMIFSTFFHKIY